VNVSDVLWVASRVVVAKNALFPKREPTPYERHVAHQLDVEWRRQYRSTEEYRRNKRFVGWYILICVVVPALIVSVSAWIGGGAAIAYLFFPLCIWCILVGNYIAWRLARRAR
jgi:hypothetical protein